MKENRNKKVRQRLLEKQNLDSILKDYETVSYEMERGEILNGKLNPRRFLLFLVSGKVRISSYRPDGSCYQVNETSAPNCFGDMEFALPEMKQHRIETVTPCMFIAVDLVRYKERIEKDPSFLLYLLRSVSYKTILVSDVQTETKDVESKVLYYLDNETENGEVNGVGLLALHLNCSRRQLQRVLNDLQKKGMIIKTGKGKYKKDTHNM